jgi:hypothetical protein
MAQGSVKQIFNFSNWKNTHKKKINDVLEFLPNGFILIKFALLDDDASVMHGDFKIDVKSSYASFYFWLNVVSIKK